MYVCALQRSMTSVAQLDELLALGFIQASEYERRRSELEFAPSASASPLPVTQPAPVPGAHPCCACPLRRSEHWAWRARYAAPERGRCGRAGASQGRARRARLCFVHTAVRPAPRVSHMAHMNSDMEDERRLLVQRVFPAVKAACRARRVAFSYVGALSSCLCHC